jgi:hypothetical protein
MDRWLAIGPLLRPARSIGEELGGAVKRGWLDGPGGRPTVDLGLGVAGFHLEVMVRALGVLAGTRPSLRSVPARSTPPRWR